MAIVCGRGIASALAGLLLAATEMAQRTAATESNPGVFLGGSNPAMYEGHGAAQDNSGTPLSYDVQTIRFSGTVLIEFSLNTAVGCKEACEENLGLGNIGVTLIGFSWYDDTLYVDGSANAGGSAVDNWCICYVKDAAQTTSFGSVTDQYGFSQYQAKYGWSYCYNCVSEQPSTQPSGQPSGQPSSLPSENPSVSHWPTSMPSENPSISTQPSFVPSSQPSGQPSSVPSENPSISTEPSSQPSESPSISAQPSSQPSNQPSGQPSSVPSEHPSISTEPSSQPSENPSISTEPSSQPSNQPSNQPSAIPSAQPSSIPSMHPSVSIWPTSMPSENPSISAQPSISTEPSSQVSYNVSTLKKFDHGLDFL